MPIEHVAETDSTNRLIAQRAAADAREGLWIRADRQTGGRGRQGRVWESPAGNLYASTLVRLREGDPPAPTLALVAGVAVWEAVSLYIKADAERLCIKWPNDLLVGPAKLAGILLERHHDAVVVGIGVNLAHAPALPDRPTAAIGDGNAAPDPAGVVQTLAELFAAELAMWRVRGLTETRSRWLARALPPGTPLRYDGEDALFETIDAAGALILRRADGSRMTVTAGDVDLLTEFP